MLTLKFYVGEMPSKEVMNLAIEEMKAQIAAMTTEEIEFVRVSSELLVDEKTIIIGDIPKVKKEKIDFGTSDETAPAEEDDKPFTLFKGKIGGTALPAGITGDYITYTLGISPEKPEYGVIKGIINQIEEPVTYLEQITVFEDHTELVVSGDNVSAEKLVIKGRTAKYLYRLVQDGKLQAVEKEEEYVPPKPDTAPEPVEKNATDPWIYDESGMPIGANPDYKPEEAPAQEPAPKEEADDLDDLLGSLDNGLDGLDDLFAAVDTALDGLGDLFGEQEIKPEPKEQEPAPEPAEDINFEDYLF